MLCEQLSSQRARAGILLLLVVLTAPLFISTTNAAPVQAGSHNLNASEATVSKTGVPHILHQVWIDATVPVRMAGWVRSWIRHNPTWKYKLWTDEDARELVIEKFPQYLKAYDAFAKPIYRADMVRYLILSVYGGIYADLDMECVRPFDDVLDVHQAIIGTEPTAHAVMLYDVDFLLTNAFMVSKPSHPYWDQVLAELENRFTTENSDPVWVTGPQLLNDVYLKYRENKQQFDAAPVHQPEPDDFFPLQGSLTGPPGQCSSGSLSQRQQDFCEKVRVIGHRLIGAGPTSYTVHHYTGVWWADNIHGYNDRERIGDIVPDHMFWEPNY